MTGAHGVTVAFGLFWPTYEPSNYLRERVKRIAPEAECYPFPSVPRPDGSLEQDLRAAMYHAARIVFDLTGLNAERVREGWPEYCRGWAHDGMTNFELRTILSDPSLFGKTHFYRDGVRVDRVDVRRDYGRPE